MAEKEKKEKENKNLSFHGNKIKLNHRYRIDDGSIGICRFRGRTLFGKSNEDWIGIVIEHGEGVHNGTVNGKRYFKCDDGKGVMIRPERIIEDLGLSDGKKLTKKMRRGSKTIKKLTKKMRRGSKTIRQLVKDIAYLKKSSKHKDLQKDLKKQQSQRTMQQQARQSLCVIAHKQLVQVFIDKTVDL
eukprot:92877_1